MFRVEQISLELSPAYGGPDFVESFNGIDMAAVD